MKTFKAAIIVALLAPKGGLVITAFPAQIRRTLA
jgi:hypothetical protein